MKLLHPIVQGDSVLQRVQGEYTEMPGLCLTAAQAQRLWGLDRASAESALGALVESKFLARTRDGAFIRSENAMAPDVREAPRT
jgi:hypothetical protein